ncbi:MAG: transglycosylase domain-containing protein, partial [Acidimicrobiales bacterium]
MSAWPAGWADARVARVLVPLAIGSAMVPVAVVAVLAAALYAVPSPALPPVSLDPRSQVTKINAADGTEIATLGGFERFIPVRGEDLPDVLKDAVVAVEDHRFYSHRGVDVRGILRAFWTNLTEGRVLEGGSTITQQYVKHAYMEEPERSLRNKIEEAVLATRLEDRLPKDEILHRYLSTVYFGGGAYGVGAAADSYFRKPVEQLTLAEAALLAGIIRAPSRLNPRSNPGGAEARRRLVLDRMHQQGRIDDVQYQSALAEGVALVAAEPPAWPATAVYPARETPSEHRYFVDYVRRYLVARYGATAVFNEGLRVETSLDPELQAMAEAAVDEALAGTDPPLAMSLVSIDPATGLVKALVGGRDFDRSEVNLALGDCDDVEPAKEGEPLCVDGGGTARQPGSSFKPFVLARALEDGMSLAERYRGPARYRFPSCRGVGCTVRNAGGDGYGTLSLRRATAYSVNTVFAQLIDDVGVKETAELAHRLGVTTIDPDGRPAGGERYGPSLALGAVEVSPLDMAAAYAVFANLGTRVPASPVVKVTTADGEVLEDNSARQGRRVLPARVARQVTEALQGVVDYGTGKAAGIDGVEVAGKTGTTDDNTDAWFVGYTPALSTAVWMGHADAKRTLVDADGNRVYGGTVPARTWAAFM